MIEGISAMMHGEEKQLEYSFIAGCERVKRMGMSILDDCCFTVDRMVKYVGAEHLFPVSSTASMVFFYSHVQEGKTMLTLLITLALYIGVSVWVKGV